MFEKTGELKLVIANKGLAGSCFAENKGLSVRVKNRSPGDAQVIGFEKKSIFQLLYLG